MELNMIDFLNEMFDVESGAYVEDFVSLFKRDFGMKVTILGRGYLLELDPDRTPVDNPNRETLAIENHGVIVRRNPSTGKWQKQPNASNSIGELT